MPNQQSDSSTSPVVVLIGMMGAGKTSVGRELAGHSKFVDIDKMIESDTSKSIREIFESDGEAAFRQIELAALKRAIDSHDYAVISTGGGVVTTEEGRNLLKNSGAFVVWLTASNAELTRRATKSGNRPLLDQDPGAKIDALMKERAHLYEEVANLILDTQGLTVKQVAQLLNESVSTRATQVKK